MENVLVMPNADFSANGIKVKVNVKDTFVFEIGNLDGSGASVASNKHIRCAPWLAEDDCIVKLDWEHYQIYLFDWGTSGSAFVSYLGNKRADFTLDAGKYYRIVITDLNQSEVITDIEDYDGYKSFRVYE